MFIAKFLIIGDEELSLPRGKKPCLFPRNFSSLSPSLSSFSLSFLLEAQISSKMSASLRTAAKRGFATGKDVRFGAEVSTLFIFFIHSWNTNSATAT